MILDDLLGDTVQELEAKESQKEAAEEAVTMQDLPTLENLLYQLQQMEVSSALFHPLTLPAGWSSKASLNHMPLTCRLNTPFASQT